MGLIWFLTVADSTLHDENRRCTERNVSNAFAVNIEVIYVHSTAPHDPRWLGGCVLYCTRRIHGLLVGYMTAMGVKVLVGGF